MVLESIWFFLWALLWAIFFMTDGFDFGVGTLYPFLGKTDKDKNTMIHSIGPLWDGNEVWLITAGGVTFAAFPIVYSVMFSSLYSALMLILFALILRGVSFEFRNKIDHTGWKKIWDICIFVGSVTPAILFGVTFANIFKGIPFDGNGHYHGTLLTLLNPYGLTGGGFFLLLFVMHGALWLCIKTQGDIQKRTLSLINFLWPIQVIAAVGFLLATYFYTNLYDNYVKYPILFLIITAPVFGLAGIKYFITKESPGKAWFASAITIIGTTFFGTVGLFPNMFPSSINPAFNLTAHNAASSPLTLKIMLVVVIIFIPMVLAYQIWVYRLFSDKIADGDIEATEAY